jgi:hypothetical protein
MEYSAMTVAVTKQERICTVIRQSPIPALRRLSVNESESTIVIEGTVGSYYLKQLAQELVKPLLDGKQLINSVAVLQR